MIALKGHMVGSGLRQAKIAKLFGVTRPRVSDLILPSPKRPLKILKQRSKSATSMAANRPHFKKA
jgi:predicted transcriptional regulator